MIVARHDVPGLEFGHFERVIPVKSRPEGPRELSPGFSLG